MINWLEKISILIFFERRYDISINFYFVKNQCMEISFTMHNKENINQF